MSRFLNALIQMGSALHYYVERLYLFLLFLLYVDTQISLQGLPS
jgi:hypothetical protein